MKYLFYRWLQNYVHTGYIQQGIILLREFNLHNTLKSESNSAASNTVVLELACGGGNFATMFPKEAYLGIDISVDRIGVARREYPDYRFEVLNINSSGFRDLVRNVDFIFCHGLLHHLNDQDCQTLLECIQHLSKKPATFVAMEPILPLWWSNPLGFLMAKLDEGRYVRFSQHYQQFFKNCNLRIEHLNFFPRWPERMEIYISRYI